MRKRIIACVIMLALLVSVFSNNQIRVNGAEKIVNTRVVVTDKTISELEPGESIVSVLGSVITCLEEEISETKNDTELRVDKYSADKYESYVQGEFSRESVELAAVLSEQMDNYLHNSSGIKAEVTDITDAEKIADGELSNVKFDLAGYDFVVDDYLMLRVMDAISMCPNLATLHTHISYGKIERKNELDKLVSLTIVSSVKKADLKERTLEYERQLSKLIEIPNSDSNMSDAEKILYVHDRIVNIGDYDTSEGVIYHTPASILLDSKGVCQSYANIFNHALLAMGMDSVMLCSVTHAWNAVRLDGKWYYVDATWDDPVIVTGVKERSYARHDYMLVQADDFATDHTLDENYSLKYGNITRAFGNAFDSFIPENVNKSYWYSDGEWYYANGTKLCTWNVKTDKYQEVDDIDQKGKMNVVEVGGIIYFANENGLYSYENGSASRIMTGKVTDLHIQRNVIYYKIDSTVEQYVVEEPEPTLTPDPMITDGPTVTDEPMATNRPVTTYSPKPTTVPGPTIIYPTIKITPTPVPQMTSVKKAKISKLKNTKNRQVMVTIKKPGNGLKCYNYCVKYSSKKSFKGAKTVYSSKNKITLKKLKKKKTYYIKVSFRYGDGTMLKQSKWSAVKKIKIKR